MASAYWSQGDPIMPTRAGAAASAPALHRTSLVSKLPHAPMGAPGGWSEHAKETRRPSTHGGVERSGSLRSQGSSLQGPLEGMRLPVCSSSAALRPPICVRRLREVLACEMEVLA